MDAVQGLDPVGETSRLARGFRRVGQRIPGQGRRVQPPVSQPPMTQVPAPHTRNDGSRRGLPRNTQPPADRLPQQPAPGQGSGPRPISYSRQDSQPLITRTDPQRGQQNTGGQQNGRPQGRTQQSRAVPPPSAGIPQDSGSRPGINPVGSGSRPGFPPAGPGSRTNLTPVSQPSRPNMTPVNPLNPPSRQGMSPVNEPSRPAMQPVNPPSRPGMTPVPPPGRPGATGLAALNGTSGLTGTPNTAGGPERREEIDPSCLTSEMDPISDVVQQKRKVDATLARFSAVHDEMAAEEAQRRSRRIKLMPWLNKDQDLEEALSAGAPVSPAVTGETRMPDEILAPEPDAMARLKSKIKQQRGRSMTWKVASGVAAALVLIAAYFGWQKIHDVSSGTGQIQEVAALDENSPAILESAKQYGDSNFLLVGTGTRPGTATAAANQVTDTIMVVHIPVDGSRAAILSFPPNLAVDRPDCQQWNNQTNKTSGDVPAQTGVKLASVYSVGGPRCVTDTVQQLTGLRINHFVGVDTSGFGSLVGSAQGVQLCVKQPLQDSKLGTIIPNAGPVTLSGQQALKFVQANQIVGANQSSADLSKITRQQRFLAAVLRKTIGQQNLLMDPPALNNFLGTFNSSTFGDNTGVDQLAKLATSLQGLSLGKITFVTVPTSTTLNAAGQETLNPTPARQLFKSIIDNSALPGEQGSAGGGGKAVQTQDVKVQVINGIGDSAPGAATQTANDLKPFGYVISGIGGPAPPNTTHTVIKYASAQQAQAQLLASSVPSATLEVDQTMGGAIQLIIGPGFDHVVQAPHTGGGNATTTANSEAPAGLSYVNAADTSCA